MFLKFLLTALLVLAAWLAFKYVTRVNAVRRSQLQQKRGGSAPGPHPAAVEDMERCGICGSYVPARGATPCGRPGCPYLP